MPQSLAPPANAPVLTRRRWLWAGCACFAAGVAGTATQRWWRPWLTGTGGTDGDICIVAPALPYDATSGLAADQPRPVPQHARCPVCGMYPARTPAWAAQVLYRDGHAHFFDSPVDLFRFLADVPRHSPGRTMADILSRWVTDMPERAWCAAERAWYVHGSDVLGPMRQPDLPAFAQQDDAARLVQKHGGQVLAFGQITPAMLAELGEDRNHALHQHRRQEGGV